jgi:hypothetical protein
MNQLGTSEEMLFARHARGTLFGDDDDTPSMSSEPCTPKSRWPSDEESSEDNDNDDDNFWM